MHCAYVSMECSITNNECLSMILPQIELLDLSHCDVLVFFSGISAEISLAKTLNNHAKLSCCL